MKKGNMLIAHGGGPTAVINTSLLGAIEEARKISSINRILGARYGVEGILNEVFVELDRKEENDIQRLRTTPASAIGSCRRKLTEEDYPVILDVFRRNDIRYFFYNGGNDSMDSCHKIASLAIKYNYNLSVIGIPKTIDNDLMMTDNCPGYGSAARYVTETFRELAQDAHSLPIHVIVAEVMGRNAGWLTASAAIAAQDNRGPHLIYLPETEFDEDRFLEDVAAVHKRLGYAFVAVSEGLKDKSGKPISTTGIVDGFGHPVVGGVSEYLSRVIMSNLGIRSRSEKPGLFGRNSIKYRSDLDVELAYNTGTFAVRSATEGNTGYMVSINRMNSEPYQYDLSLVPLEKVANCERKFPAEWINESKNGVKKEFLDYCLPLIGTNLPEFISFDM